MQILEERYPYDLEPETLSQPLRTLAMAALVGIGAELALHEWLIDAGQPGLGISVAAAIAVGGLFASTAGRGKLPDSTSTALFVPAVVFAALVSVRASPALTFLNLSSAVFLVCLGTATQHARSQVPEFATDFVRVTAAAVSHALFGTLLYVFRDLPESGRSAPRRFRRVGIGAALAAPLLLVFGALFASADQVFGAVVRAAVSFEVSPGITAGIALAVMLTGLTLGLMRHSLIRSNEQEEPWEPRPLGSTESSTLMWLLNGLFGLFVAFQIFELFTSYQSATVSYAQQARSGFFQLVSVAAIVIAVVLVLDWLATNDSRPRLHRQLRVLIAFTGAILVSAVVRMALYVDAYGLTELRVYTTGFMLWIGFALVWLTATVLREHRRGFAQPAVAALLVAVLALNVVNPDAVIAGYNLDHQATSGPRVDQTYLVTALSPDAIPSIADRIVTVGDACAQLELVEKLTVEDSNDIRSWNWSRRNAAATVMALRADLDSACQSG